MEFRERLAAREVFSKTACEKNRLLPSPLAPSLAAACRPDPTRSSNRPEQTRCRPADSAISRLVWILVRRPRYSAPYPYRIIGRKTEGYPAPIFPIKQAFIGSFLSHDGAVTKANHTNLQQIGSLTPRRVGARAVLVPLSNREAIWDTVDDAVLHYEIYRGGGADIGDGIA